jgi:hypothetical protein
MFEYNGNIPQVREAINEHRDRLINVYREIFGKRYETLEQMTARLSPTQSLDSITERDIRFDSSGATPADDNSCFFVNCLFDYNLMIYPTGKVGRNIARLSPLIFISESTIEPASQSEKYRGLPKYLLPYVHEFNHFALFCFQNIPDALVGIIGWGKAEEYGELDRQNPTENVNPNQLPWIRLFAHQFCVSEDTQDFLTSQVLERLGYNGKQIIADPGSKKRMSQYGIRDIPTLFEFSANWNRRIKPFDKFQEMFFKTIGNIEVIKEPYHHKDV